MHILKTIVIVIIAAVLASCSTSTQKQLSQSYYFKDTEDNGNNAGKAGCHVEYLTSACNQGQVIGVTGDSCLSDKSINEYTNNRTCHEHNTNTSPADISSINCDTYCGSRGGSCEEVKDVCDVRGIKSDSAHCVCNE